MHGDLERLELNFGADTLGPGKIVEFKL